MIEVLCKLIHFYYILDYVIQAKVNKICIDFQEVVFKLYTFLVFNIQEKLDC